MSLFPRIIRLPVLQVFNCASDRYISYSGLFKAVCEVHITFERDIALWSSCTGLVNSFHGMTIVRETAPKHVYLPSLVLLDEVES